MGALITFYSWVSKHCFFTSLFLSTTLQLRSEYGRLLIPTTGTVLAPTWQLEPSSSFCFGSRRESVLDWPLGGSVGNPEQCWLLLSVLLQADTLTDLEALLIWGYGRTSGAMGVRITPGIWPGSVVLGLKMKEQGDGVACTSGLLPLSELSTGGCARILTLEERAELLACLFQ